MAQLIGFERKVYAAIGVFPQNLILVPDPLTHKSLELAFKFNFNRKGLGTAGPDSHLGVNVVFKLKILGEGKLLFCNLKEEYDPRITKEKYSDFIEHMKSFENNIRSPYAPRPNPIQKSSGT